MPRKHGVVRRPASPPTMVACRHRPNPPAPCPPPGARPRGHRSAREEARPPWPRARALPFPVIDNHAISTSPTATSSSACDHVARTAAAGVDARITIGSDRAVRWTAALPLEDCPASLRGGVAVHPNEAALHARGHDHEGRGWWASMRRSRRSPSCCAAPAWWWWGDGAGLVPHQARRRAGPHRPDRLLPRPHRAGQGAGPAAADHDRDAP